MKIAHVVRAAIAPLVLVACAPGADQLTDPTVSMELVDPDQRVKETDINSWVFGTFTVSVTGDATVKRVLGMNGQEPASFPGIGVFYGGHCIEGKWYNPKKKPTSGTPDKPHPHCTEWEPGESMTIVLEPISAKHEASFHPNTGVLQNRNLQLGTDDTCNMRVRYVSGSNQTNGCGLIVAYAIDLATITDAEPRRVGTITFNLAEFDNNPTQGELFGFDTDCAGITAIMGEAVSGCLMPNNDLKLVNASYAPLAVGGVGSAQSVQGILYWDGNRAGQGRYNDR